MLRGENVAKQNKTKQNKIKNKNKNKQKKSLSKLRSIPLRGISGPSAKDSRLPCLRRSSFASGGVSRLRRSHSSFGLLRWSMIQFSFFRTRLWRSRSKVSPKTSCFWNLVIESIAESSFDKNYKLTYFKKDLAKPF